MCAAARCNGAWLGSMRLIVTGWMHDEPRTEKCRVLTLLHKASGTYEAPEGGAFRDNNLRQQFTARRSAMGIGTILLIVLILMLVGVIPTWSHSRAWGYGPSGGIGLVLLIVLVLVLMGRI